MSLGGVLGSTPSVPQPPKFKPVNIPKTGAQALQFDITGYNLSDADFLSRFPGLVAQRTQNIQNAVNQITGPLDPTVEGQFTTSGLANALAAYGGGNPMASIGGQGSAARGSIASSVAQQTLAKQDYDRTYLAQLLADNPQRTFGFSGQDAVQIAIANALGQNNAAYQRYQAQVAGVNAQNAAAQQQFLTSLQIASSIASAAASDRDLKEHITYVGISRSGIPIAEFNYRGEPHVRLRGVIAQDVLKVQPSAVVHRGHYLFVKYSDIDVPFERVTAI